MAADLEYVRNVSLSSGTSTYITLDLSGMSAYKDAVIFFQGFLSGNDNDGSSVRLQAYTASGWQQSYNSSSYIFNNHNATSTTYHNNNNPGMQLNGKWTTHQTLYGWAQTGGMGCMMIEIMNFSASGSRAPIVQFQTGTPVSYTHLTLATISSV